MRLGKRDTSTAWSKRGPASGKANLLHRAMAEASDGKGQGTHERSFGPSLQQWCNYPGSEHLFAKHQRNTLIADGEDIPADGAGERV